MKKYLLGMFAIILAITFTAFTDVSVKKTTKKQLGNVTMYFEYTPTTIFTEGSFENTANWTYVGLSAGTDPCSSGLDERVCVSHADLDETLSTDMARKSAFVSFLQSQPTAVGYLDPNGFNLDYLKEDETP